MNPLQGAGTKPVITGIVQALNGCVLKAVVPSHQPGPTQANEIRTEDIPCDIRAINLSMHPLLATGN
jgi:hypothetical protein